MAMADRAWVTSAIQAAVLGLLALGVRLVHIDSIPPDFDEIYHLLAARGWLAEGVFRVGDGIYDRAAPFTLVVAGSIRAFGESFAAARLPAAIAGTLWVLA